MNESIPTYALVDWAESEQVVKHPYDRPWFSVNLNKTHFPTATCRCTNKVHLYNYPCDDKVSRLHIGQCSICETILWVLEGGHEDT